MSTSTAIRPPVRSALSALIDYAGLFPPAQLAIVEASSEYQAARRGPYAWMLGRFIIPAPLLLTSSHELEGPCSVIADGERETLDAIAALAANQIGVEALEIPLPADDSPADIVDAIGELRAAIVDTGLGDRPVFVELPRSDRWSKLLPDAMEALGRDNLGAKLRCGGVTAEAFPSVREVANFIAAAVAARVPFKATAGLHHPVRQLDAASGFMMHGFLNLLAASALAPRVNFDTLARIVAEEDADAFGFDDASFVWRKERIGVPELSQTRRETFVAYGSCSFTEPVSELLSLGLLPAL
jgi:hypothetical protein